MKRIDLSGNCRWFLIGTDEQGSALEIPCSLPCDNASVLLENNLIPDPYFGKNEETVQWIARKDWTFAGIFQVEEINPESEYFLNLDSVDTVAEIYLNGHHIGSTENMFLRFREWVREYLIPGENRLEIRIQSPLTAAQERKEKYPYPLAGNANNAVENLQFLRKVQSSGGWDWGICLPVSGIYGEMYLREVSSARIEHVDVEQLFSEEGVQVKIHVELEAWKSGTVPVAVKLAEEEIRKSVEVSSGRTKETFSFLIRDPELWYPVGYGEQPLYDLSVETDCEKREQKIGLRQVELLQTPDGEHSAEFCFRINGVRVFCKGANWIPADAIPKRITEEKIRESINDALLANMNMLRVWGGGWYESEAFYRICDEVGIMVWQDCLFACAQYPENEEFLESMALELEYQVKRLNSHPCMVLWCGDNEIYWCYGEYANEPDRFASALLYDRVNRAVMKQLKQYSLNVPIWNSSPYKNPYLLLEPVKNAAMGDIHYWDVWHGGKPFSAYYGLQPRFCSEFGFQSFPSLQAIRKNISENQYNIFSPEMENHQKNGIGNARILATFCQYFRMPDSFEHIIYLSQVQQAVAIQMAVEYWRTLRPYCMGTLYWQLNDNWPVASWSSVDYEGNWKILHYAAAGFYAPVLLTAHPGENNTVRFHLVNDTLAPVSGMFKIEFYDFEGNRKLLLETSVEIPGENSHLLQELPVEQEHLNGFYSYSFTPVQGKTIRKEYFLQPYKKYELPKSEPLVEVIPSGTGFDVKITSGEFAFFCFAELENCLCRWNENAVTLYPGESMILHAEPERSLSIAEFRSGLRLTHLGSSYR